MKFRIYIVAFLFSGLLFSQVKSEEILIKNDSIKLPGTLTYIEGTSPLIIWVHGSGNVDRNGNQAVYNVNANYIKKFRDSINNKGISFFSYDKRTSNPDNKNYFENIVFEDFVDDVETVINHFKKDKRFSSITLIGHSQGSLVAMLASKNSDKYISLEGPSKTIDEVLIEQFSKQNHIVVDTLKAHLKELKVTGNINYVNPYLRTLLSKQNIPFIASWMKYDPSEVISKLNMPILIINGTKDLQVSVKDAEILNKANPRSKLVIIENMNHVLKNIEKDEDNLKSYYSPDYPLSKKLIKVITNFILKK